MIKSPRVHPASGPGGDALIMRGRFVGDCTRLLGERLPSLWGALFGKLDDALHDLADRSTNDSSYRVYFDAREILVKQRRRLQSDFLRRVEQGAGDLVGRDREREHEHGRGTESGFGDLALLAQSELEEILAAENLVSKAESRYRSDLLELDRRFAALLGWGEVGLEENPFGPSALCHAFRDTLSALPPFEPSVKLVVYKLFDRHVMDQLGDFYRSCLSQVEPAAAEIAIPAARPYAASPSVSSFVTPSTPMDRYFRAFLAREDTRAAAGAGDPPAEPNGAKSFGLFGRAVAIFDADRTGAPVDPEPETVAAALADRLAPYARIPSTVEVLLREGWSLVLLEIHRSRGSDSPEWQAALELIDRLLWSVSAKRTAEERRQLLDRIPRLLETLRRGLSEVGCDPRLTARWLGELQTLHLDVLQGSARGAVLGGSDVETARSVPAPIPVPCGCAIGDWIDWAREDVGRVRLKLVAWNPAREELLFFDRQGRSPTRFSARGLAEAIGAGRVTILGNGETPLADHAWRAMMTSLQKAPSDG
ncbi:MAG: DUF1631 family protein [Thiocapsa sp.]|uniref:DUF1631 family protein n=1 Tax=Thiocapsa sp. TaxID=2024551 RepID=UPI001BD14F9E|nr:DUF1631 family protein [Thiocapsa sp.]QVL46839.1 MAG: DUF1631 family protein [Thiocapsa sp.]